MQRSLNLLKRNFLNSLYIFFLGSISAYSLPPYNYFIINFITFSSLFIFLLKKKKENLNHLSFFKYGWFFGFGYFSFSLYWISIALTFDQSFKFLIPIAIILLPATLAIFYGLITLLFSIFFKKNIIVSFLTFSILFGMIEFIRGFIMTGFPWNLISFSFSSNIYFIQILSVIGTYSFNLICISIFTVPAVYFFRKSKKEIIVCFFFLLIFLGFFTFGILQSGKFNSLESVKNNYIIRALSPNISLDRFSSQENEFKLINELIKLSNPEKKKPTIYLWPEGIIPESYLEDMDVYKELFSKNFGNNDLIIMGLKSREHLDGENLYFNSLAIFNNKLELIQKYNKVNLVPFGEFVPFENILSLIGFKTITNEYQSFSSGNTRNLLEIRNNKLKLNLLPLICYEIIYSGRLSKNKNFDFIINISEDGWFGNSIGPKQHFAHSIFRSIESGKYIIRSANNGITAIINPIGMAEKKVEFGLKGYIDFEVSKSIKPTFFSVYGNKIFILLILLYIFLIFSFKKLTNE